MVMLYGRVFIKTVQQLLKIIVTRFDNYNTLPEQIHILSYDVKFYNTIYIPSAVWISTIIYWYRVERFFSIKFNAIEFAYQTWPFGHLSKIQRFKYLLDIFILQSDLKYTSVSLATQYCNSFYKIYHFLRKLPINKCQLYTVLYKYNFVFTISFQQ